MQRYRVGLLLLVLAVATLVSYWPVVHSSFINFDDDIYVYSNPRVTGGLTWEGALWAFTDAGYGSNWHPLTWISHQVDVELFGLDPRGHHLVNLLLHLGSVSLLLVFLHRATADLRLSALTAALFALHPLHVESVAWVAERKDVLSVLFGMATLSAYLAYVRKPGLGSYLLTTVSLALGLMAKPMLVTLPFVLLLLDFWPLGRLGARGWKSRVVEKIPMMALCVFSSVMTLAAQARGGALGPWDRLPMAARIAGSLKAYVAYLGKTLWPVGLSVIYPYPVHTLDRVVSWSALAAGLLLLLLTAAVIGSSKARPYLVTGWLWYVGTLVPVIGLVQVGNQSMADRYTYLPHVGIFILTVWGIAELVRALSWPRLIPRAAALLVLAILVPLTRRQAGWWKDAITLFTHATAVTEGNWQAHKTLGFAFFTQGKVREAEREYREALRIFPGMPEVANNLGSLLVEQGRHLEAIDQFRLALRGKPTYAMAHYNLGSNLIALNRLGEAVQELRTAIDLSPRDPRPHNNLGAALYRLGQAGDAVREYQEALRLSPGYIDARCNLALALESLGRTDEARVEYLTAIRLQPGYAPAVQGLGRIGSGPVGSRSAPGP